MAGGLQRTPHSSTAATRGASRPRCGGCSGDPALPRPSPFPGGPEPPAHPARVSSIRALGTSRKVLVAGRGCGTRGPSSDALPCSSGRGGQKGHATGEELAALQAAARTRQGWGHPEEGCHGGAELHGAVAPPHGNGTACSGQSPTWHGGGQLLPAALHVPCPVAGIAAVAGEGGAGDHEGACPPSLHQGPGRSRGTERAVRSGVTPGSGPGGAAGESAGRGRRRGHRQGLLGGQLCPSHRATLEDTPCLREEGVPHSWGPPACAAQAPRPVTPSPSSEVLGTA